METVMVNIEGICPLLMHSNAGVNPFHPLAIEIAKLTKKRTKTEEDQLKILDLEYQISSYYDDKTGMYIPAENVEACLRDAAKARKKGKDFTKAIFVEPGFIPLQHDGPQDMEGLLKDHRFRDVRPAKIGRSTIVRCRPRFNKWAIEFTIEYDAEILDRQDILNALDVGGKYIGLLDYRPRYGRFAAEMVS